MIVQTDLYKRAVEKYGKDHQLGVTIEEMGECIAQISQFMVRDRGTEQDLIDEIADVCIMMGQMKVIYGQDLVNAVNKKLKKLEGHINA